jgi:hypothetical protein
MLADLQSALQQAAARFESAKLEKVYLMLTAD